MICKQHQNLDITDGLLAQQNPPAARQLALEGQRREPDREHGEALRREARRAGEAAASGATSATSDATLKATAPRMKP